MKNLILFITLLLSSLSYSQKHSVFGGNIEVTQIGSNQFIISASVQIDSFNVTSMTINAFDNATDTFVKTFTISLDSSAIIPLRYQTHVIDTIYVNYLSDTFSIPNNPNGYYFVNNEFNRIRNVRNFENGNYIFTCQIPDPAISGGNSNPKFVNFNDSLLLILGERKLLNFSCQDNDGDSLNYSIFQPFDSVSTIGGRPFTRVPLKPGHTLMNLFGPGPVCNLNSNTGYVTAGMAILSKYALTVKCEEFRNGVKIGEVQRDITLCPNRVFYSVDENSFSSNLKIYPNPTSSIVNIQADFKKSGTLKASLLDANGRIIQSKEWKLESGKEKNQLDITSVAQGNYFLNINYNNQNNTYKIQKIK